MPDTIQCRNCGEPNDVGTAVCSACNSPLTAYAGQITGLDETSAKLKEQVAKLDVRPPVVVAAVILDGLFAVFGPLAATIGAFMARPATNSEGTNYIGSALGVVGPIFKAIFLLPIAIAIAVVALGAWTQRPWAWTANLVILVLFGIGGLFQFGFNFLIGLVMIGVAAALIVMWLAKDTKAWYGMNE